MELSSLEKLFVKNDIYYPSLCRGSSVWGTKGLGIFRRIQENMSLRLNGLGYREMLLPAICPDKTLYDFVGGNEKSKSIVTTDLDEGGDSLGLRPFSEVSYVKLVVDNPNHYPSCFYQWSNCFLKEPKPNLYLNFQEMLKCEIFSLNQNKKAAYEQQERLAEIFKSFVEDDLCIKAYWGTRPRQFVFPNTEISLNAEVSLRRQGLFWTLLVSHVMKPDFVEHILGSDAGGKVLCSAGFSQKLLATMLLHHSEGDFWHCPPALLPFVGEVIADEQELEVIREKLDASELKRIRLRSFDEGGTGKESLGVVWKLIRLTSPSADGCPWEVTFSNFMNKDSQKYRHFDDAMIEARASLLAYEDYLRQRSEKAQEDDLLILENLQKVSELNVDEIGSCAVPLCPSECCLSGCLKSCAWVPKLEISRDPRGRCISCQSTATRMVLFVNDERYSNFYIKASETSS